MGEIGMNNLDVENINQIQDQPSIMGSDEKVVSIKNLEPDGTAAFFAAYTKVT